MRINTNISAMNTYGRLTNANAAKSESLSKLSSGLRINKAGDDAAGLAISEKMKGQVGGLNQAVRNAQDGVSLIQTAEGALNETHAILGRMRDLATQGANGTLSQDDRAEINKEFDALKTEITRISDTTEFNTKKLLNTNGQNFTFQIGANGGQTMSVKIDKMDADTLGLTGSALASSKVTDAQYDADAKVDAAKTYKTGLTTALAAFDPNTDTIDSTQTAYEKEVAGFEAKAWSLDSTAILTQAQVDTLATAGVTASVGAEWNTVSTDVGNLTADADSVAEAKMNLDIAKAAKGATGADFDAVAAELQNKADEGIAAAKASVEDRFGRKNASDAIADIDAAIKTVSSQRSDLGAAQNRLSHTVKNLTTTKENLAEANSRIRDVDMAEEMMSFTKSNILSQAATSMLSQANAMPNSVLGLLQG